LKIPSGREPSRHSLSSKKKTKLKRELSKFKKAREESKESKEKK
jgi:hypothetical protein